ncbi:hypothetical protein H6P81_018701 [Aristolochia fimbriata]|uniref:Uncharacterized protein n=1 Tax=Aristolochia fimbriata TaxID=158543 RepID=A0AAV7E4W0_ARIFI|nr:hypothetical protein H6P81_018701 [Aristolochia fimbriata]
MVVADHGFGFAIISACRRGSSLKKRKLGEEGSARGMEREEVLVEERERRSCSVNRTPPPPPPPLPPRPLWSARRRTVACRSVTREEIERFWRKKRLDEEDHFLAALKAAARIRARNFKDEEYRRFEESLQDGDQEDEDDEQRKSPMTEKQDENLAEIRVGIKDWWTKSKYAYLNQPAIQAMEKPKRISTYTPNYMCFYRPPTQPYSLMGFSQ